MRQKTSARLANLVVPGTEAVVPLIGFVTLLTAIPSELVFRPLGAAGTPAGVLCIGLFMWWVASRVAGPSSHTRTNPTKWLLAAFGTAALLSYIAGMSRPIYDAAEVSSADRALLALSGWLGLSLVTMDGLTSRASIDRLLRALCVAAACIGVLGGLQFFLHLDLAHVITVPGLTPNGAFGELISRSAYRRVTGTASHPIEFGVVLAAVLPLAIHYARFADGRRRWVAWAPAFLIAGTLPLSVARSGMLGMVVVFLVMFGTWPTQFRWTCLKALVVGAGLMSVIVPGLLGTIRGLFTNAANDPSTQGRTADYGPSLAYVDEAPWFGRGFGTFIPSLYRTLDNQYLGLLVETGIVGLAAAIALLVGCMVIATRARRWFSLDRDRDLAHSLVASLAVVAVNAATFDMFGFAMCAGVTFLLVGAVGALYAVSGLQVPRERRGLPRRTNALVMAVGVAVGGAALASTLVAVPEYDARGSLILLAPGSAQRLPLLSTAGSASLTTSLIHDVVESPGEREDLRRRGVANFDLAIGDGSLMMGSDRSGSGGPVLQVVTRAADPTVADAALRTVYTQVETSLASLQDTIRVPMTERIRIDVLATNNAYPVRGKATRARVASALLACLAMAFMHQALVSRPRRFPRADGTASLVPRMRQWSR